MSTLKWKLYSYGAVFILRTMLCCISKEDPTCAVYLCPPSYWNYYSINVYLLLVHPLHLLFTLLYHGCSISTLLLLQSSQLLLYQCLPSYWNYYSINVHLLLVYYYSFTNFRKSLSIKPSEKNINSCKKISRN